MLLHLLAIASAQARADTSCAASAVRWAASSNTIYATGAVSCTLSDLHGLLPDAPLTVDAGQVWTLGANLFLEQGATLVLHGPSIGGDVAELRLKSDDTSYVEIRALWGDIDIASTRVTSWDSTLNGPDTEVNTHGRAFIRALSYLDGTTPRTSRMDIKDSEIGWLGYYASESYGLVWKVRGDTPGLFDQVDVLGDVTGNEIHDNFFGLYTFGAYGMHIADNEVWNNAWYGVDPHDDSDALVVEDNYIHHNGHHGFICSQRCDGLEVRRNTSSFNGQAGFMFHRAVTDSVLEDNVAEGNGDAGYAIVDSHHNTIRDNIARDNADGLRLCTGASQNLVTGNLLSDNQRYGINFYVGSDPPSINDGRPTQNDFQDNEIDRNGDLGIRGSEAYANTFEDNSIRDNVTWDVSLSDATDNVFSGNRIGARGFYAAGASTNAVTDSAGATVTFSGTSAEMDFTDTRGRVFSNDAGLPTSVAQTGTALAVSSAKGATLVNVAARPLTVSPADGDLQVDVDAWGKMRRAWTTMPGSATQADFAISGLGSGTTWALAIDGVAQSRLVADTTGVVRFTHDVGTGTHTFVLARVQQMQP